jgi:Tfp pilus assembly protein PilF
MGKVDEAVQYWKKGWEQDPDSPLIHMNLGNMYRNHGQPEKAKESYAIAAAGMPYSIQLRILEDELGFDLF